MKHDRKHNRKGDRTIALVNSSVIPVDEAIEAVATIGGTVFDVKLKKLDGNPVWRVKLLRGMELVKVYVDAESGQIVEAQVAVEALQPGLV
jgi:uncharacterized membrane protein YkoI